MSGTGHSRVRLAIVGDIHGAWTDADARWFEQAAYDQVVVIGDLAGLRWSKTLAVAEHLGRMQAPTIVLPGNHDATHVVGLLSEAISQPRLGNLFAGTSAPRVDALREAIGRHALGAYTSHRVGEITMIAGRPHSMGGPTLSFASHLARVWDVRSLAESTARLCALVDAADTHRIIFVSHNGPTGLGAKRSDIWGCDFRAAEGDWGDPDLREAIDYAMASGKRVVAVVAGHMHRRLKGGGERVWRVESEGIVYANAAVVPRISKGRHHHLSLTVEGDGVTIEDQFVEVS